MFYLVHQFGLVSVLPDFHQNDRRVESEKDAEGQGDALNDWPSVVTKEPKLNWRVLYFLHFKCVYDPHCEVADEKEGNNLASRLWILVIGRVDASPLSVSDEQKLKHDLNDCDGAGGKYQ